MINRMISDKCVEIANEIVGNVATSCYYSSIDFTIPVGNETLLKYGALKESNLLKLWEDLVVSYFTTCKFMYPNNNKFSICWGTKPDIISIDGEKYVLFSSFIIVPEDGRQISKRVVFCPHCSKGFELDASLQAKESTSLSHCR